MFCYALASLAAGANESSADKVSFKGEVRTVTLKRDVSTGLGVYYFKAKLKRAGAYTIWTEGLVEPADTNKVAVTVDAYPSESDDEDDDPPGADFSSVEEPGANIRLIMYSDDWTWGEEDKEDNDPKEWTYYVLVTGNVGDSVTIHFAAGAIIPAGREDNPRTLSPTTSTNKVSSTLELNDEYYFRARLNAGQLYWFGTAGGTATNAFDISVISDGAKISDGSSGGEEEEDAYYSMYDDPAYDDRPNDYGCFVVPDETGYFSIIVSGGNPEAVDDPTQSNKWTGAAFTFYHKTYNTVKPAKHDSTLLDSTTGYEADFTAGCKSSPANLQKNVYDEIIDESLFRFKAVKGWRYMPRTTGATTNLMLRIYDANGNIVDENRGDGQSYNVKCGFQSDKAALFYIGVCRDVDDIFNNPVDPTQARLVIDQNVQTVAGSPDKYDPADDTYLGATELFPVNGTGADAPEDADKAGSDWHRLNATDWYDVYKINCSAGVTYTMGITFEDPANSYNALQCDVFTVSGNKEAPVDSGGDINPGDPPRFMFTAAQDGWHYVRMRTKGGLGLEFPKYKVHVKDSWGTLKVNIGGTSGFGAGYWYVDSDTTPRAGGSSLVIPAGQHRLSFSAVNGLGRPATRTVTVESGKSNVSEFNVWYGDTGDPDDDSAKSPEAWDLTTGDTRKGTRTLWPEDEDNFSFYAKDGYYYTFRISSANGADAVFSIVNAKAGVSYTNLTEVTDLALPHSYSKYVVTVSRGENAAKVTTATTAKPTYSLVGRYKDVGAIQLAKTGISAKETAYSVSLVLKRTGGTGRIRARYGTAGDTATPGEDYVPATGIVEWGDRDMTAKTVTVALLPDLVARYEGDEKFSIVFEPMDPEEIGPGEYRAVFANGKSSATVTIKETSRAGTTEEDTYSKSYVKGATVKTEDVPLYTGTFGGILVAKDGSLTNGLPALASVSFTASVKDALSAKVDLAGKSYKFSAKQWDSKDAETGGSVVMEQVQTVAKVKYTNTLEIAVAGGQSSASGAWLAAGGTARMTMNVPDANNKGAQEGIEYEGRLWRDNSKVQEFLTAVTNYAGYYTIALVPDGVTAEDGVPFGNGFLTVTIDNKGKAKVAGQLPDGTTKPSATAVSAFDGDDLVIPVYSSKSPYCFGGELVIFNAGTNGVVATNGVKASTVRSSKGLLWNNDNAALTYGGTNGWSMTMIPVGGWYDKVASLQAYYRDYALSVDTVAISEFPKESLKNEDYSWSTDDATEAAGYAIGLKGDVYSYEKTKLVKPKGEKTYDFGISTNAANVQVKLARATGVVTGGFDAWQSGFEKGVEKQQKTNVKSNGILVFNRDPDASVGEGIDSFGYFTLKNVKIPYEVTNSTGKVSVKTRNWTYSAPFNLAASYLGETDWWGVDWGTEPAPEEVVEEENDGQ